MNARLQASRECKDNTTGVPHWFQWLSSSSSIQLDSLGLLEWMFHNLWQKWKAETKTTLLSTIRFSHVLSLTCQIKVIFMCSYWFSIPNEKTKLQPTKATFLFFNQSNIAPRWLNKFFFVLEKGREQLKTLFCICRRWRAMSWQEEGT